MQLKGKPCGALSRTCLLELEDTSILFMDLSVACVDDYSVVHEIRQIEHTEFGSSIFTPQVLVVAITDLDRCMLP
jgi:hypothetical protein